jgi:hypothetical protein
MLPAPLELLEFFAVVVLLARAADEVEVDALVVGPAALAAGDVELVDPVVAVFVVFPPPITAWAADENCPFPPLIVNLAENAM